MTHVEQFHTWIMDRMKPTSSALSGMLILEGPAGSGKTTLLTEWLASYCGEGKYKVRPAQRQFLPEDEEQSQPVIIPHIFTARRGETPTQFAYRLIEELGSHPNAHSATRLWEEVIWYLKSFRIQLLIIDQCERLSLKLCQCIQDYIFDQRICSLLMVGTSAFIATLHRDPSLPSRVRDWHKITDFDQPTDLLPHPST